MRLHITALGMFLIGLLGCKSPKVPPDDPLFFSHAPIEVKANHAPVASAAATPEPPPEDPMIVRRNLPAY